MSDPGKVIVAVSFFATVSYVVRLLVVNARSLMSRGSRTTHDVVVDDERMTRLEQAVESIALEVERISEGQRFTTQLLADRAQADLLRAVSATEPNRHTTPH
jgi:hypothetical protein